jgi:hypothetical protein
MGFSSLDDAEPRGRVMRTRLSALINRTTAASNRSPAGEIAVAFAWRRTAALPCPAIKSASWMEGWAGEGPRTACECGCDKFFVPLPTAQSAASAGDQHHPRRPVVCCWRSSSPVPAGPDVRAVQVEGRPLGPDARDRDEVVPQGRPGCRPLQRVGGAPRSSSVAVSPLFQVL